LGQNEGGSVLRQLTWLTERGVPHWLLLRLSLRVRVANQPKAGSGVPGCKRGGCWVPTFFRSLRLASGGLARVDLRQYIYD
jgi:hypothetical protein